jgi:hypothetical protein
MDRHPLPTTVEEEIANLVFARFPATQCWLRDDKAVRAGEAENVDEVAKKFVLEFQTPQIFGGKRWADGEPAPVIEKRSPAIGMLVLFDEPTPEADDVLGSFRVEVSRVGDGSEKSGCRDYLALAFGDLEAVFLVIRNSEGVWAKNSARDITG